MFEILASLLLAQLAGSRTLHLTADNEAIWPSKEEDGVERTAWREWRGENGVERTAWRGQRGEACACGYYLSVCRFKESHRMSQVHLTAVLAAGVPLSFDTRT